MAKFAYNNAKNANTGHTLFELNCEYLSQVLFKKNINSGSKSCFTNKLAKKLRKLREIYCQNLFHALELQKRADDEKVKSSSYILSNKILLNSKYIKTKQNQKLENKFSSPF